MSHTKKCLQKKYGFKAGYISSRTSSSLQVSGTYKRMTTLRGLSQKKRESTCKLQPFTFHLKIRTKKLAWCQIKINQTSSVHPIRNHEPDHATNHEAHQKEPNTWERGEPTIIPLSRDCRTHGHLTLAYGWWETSRGEKHDHLPMNHVTLKRLVVLLSEVEKC